MRKDQRGLVLVGGSLELGDLAGAATGASQLGDLMGGGAAGAAQQAGECFEQQAGLVVRVSCWNSGLKGCSDIPGLTIASTMLFDMSTVWLICRWAWQAADTRFRF